MKEYEIEVYKIKEILRKMLEYSCHKGMNREQYKEVSGMIDDV